MNEIVLLVVTYYIIAIFSIIIVLNVIEYFKKKKLKSEIDELDIEKNSMIDSSILSEFSKVEALNKTEALNIRYELWKKEIEDIRKDLNESVNEMIIDADFLIDQKDYNEYNRKKIIIEIKLYELEALKEKILSGIKEITESEEKNRKRITDLKTKFRNLIHIYNTSKETFHPIESVIDLQIETIVKKLEDFEYDMEHQDYISANKLIDLIDTLITHFETIVDEVPPSLAMSNNIIPKRVLDVKSTYENMMMSGYQLDYLNVEYNLDEINKKLVDINTRIGILNLNDVVFELKTILEYTDTLFDNFEREKIARKEYEQDVTLFKSKVKKINDIMNKLFGKVVDAQYNYQLPADKLKSLDELSGELEMLDEDFDKLYDATRTSSFPYTRLNNELKLLVIKLSKVEEKLDGYIDSIGNMKEDEKRAREQLDDMNALLETSKVTIRSYKLPVIPESYYVELNEASEAIREVNKELNKKPITIDVLNTRVDTARDLAFKVNNTANELVKTASLAETAYVYANRYRSKKEYIDDGLNKSEVLFLKGEYKKSLDLTLSTIDIIEPGVYKKIVNMKK